MDMDMDMGMDTVMDIAIKNKQMRLKYCILTPILFHKGNLNLLRNILKIGIEIKTVGALFL
jgi:hypothetical protein